jgi:integrase
MMGRINQEGWRYFQKPDGRKKSHVIRVYRRNAPRGRPTYRDFYYETMTDAMSHTKHLVDMYGEWRPKMLLGDYLPSWLERRKTDHDLAPNTVAKYTGHIEHDINGFAIAGVAVEDIKIRHVTTWQRDLKSRPKLTSTGQSTSETISAITRRSALRMLRTALRDAKIEGLLARENPAVVATAPTVEPYHKPDLMDSEIGRLFRALMSDEDAALWWTFVNLGRRRGEVLAIRLQGFNPSDRVVEMEHSLTRGNKTAVLSKGKSHEPRAPVPVYLVELLEGQVERRAAMRLAAGDRWTDTPFLFTTKVGTPMDPNKVSRRFQEIRRGAAVPYLRLHDLRTYCATLLLELTTDLRQVQAFIGWSTIEMAADYSRVSMERRAALGEMLSAKTRSYLDGGTLTSGVTNDVRHPDDSRPAAAHIADSNGDQPANQSTFEEGTRDFGVRGSIVPQSVSDLITWFQVPSPVPESSSDTASCPIMGCQGECQAKLPPPYQRTKILLAIQTHPILGPALRAVERAEADPLVRKQLRVGIARYLWWCVAHGVEPTLADERQLAFAFEIGPDSVSYRRQLRSYARRFVEEIIEQARPREARDGSAIGVRHRPTRSKVKPSNAKRSTVVVHETGQPPSPPPARTRTSNTRSVPPRSRNAAGTSQSSERRGVARKAPKSPA